MDLYFINLYSNIFVSGLIDDTITENKFFYRKDKEHIARLMDAKQFAHTQIKEHKKDSDVWKRYTTMKESLSFYIFYLLEHSEWYPLITKKADEIMTNLSNYLKYHQIRFYKERIDEFKLLPHEHVDIERANKYIRACYNEKIKVALE
jgi:hypothetical protein